MKDGLKMIRFQQEQIEVLMGIKLALTSLIDLKDHYTEGHSINVRDLVSSFSTYLKLPQTDIEEIELAAELHDIGKIGIPDHILKKKGTLDENEFSEIRKHPSLGADSTQPLKGFDKISKIIRHHHEKFSGTGYPDGLANKTIPLGSRIITICDVFDAMTHSRSYHKAMDKNKVLEIMDAEKGTHFDPEILDSFVKFIGEYRHVTEYDPVCGMTLKNTRILFKSSHNNRTYSFCSNACLKKFNSFPEEYVTRNDDIEEKDSVTSN